MTKKATYWLGTDEAGYGSRLGPLVVSASTWQIDSETAGSWDFGDFNCLTIADQLDWHQAFACGQGDRSPAMQVLDSKKLYSAGKSLDGLQRVVSSLLSSCGVSLDTVETFSKLGRHLSIPCLPFNEIYWLTTESEIAFSHSTNEKQFQLDADAWREKQIQIIGCRSAIINEPTFNAGLVSAGNKATLLSRTTLKLVRYWLDNLPESANIIVDLDRHGGRKKYLALLLEATEADWIEVVQENPRVSIYRWTTEERTIYFRFSVKGESRFPVAMASIFSKLLRERAMDCFNRYWQLKKNDLSSTAGYPVDAQRFKNDTNELRKTMDLADEIFWRNA